MYAPSHSSARSRALKATCACCWNFVLETWCLWRKAASRDGVMQSFERPGWDSPPSLPNPCPTFASSPRWGGCANIVGILFGKGSAMNKQGTESTDEKQIQRDLWNYSANRRFDEHLNTDEQLHTVSKPRAAGPKEPLPPRPSLAVFDSWSVTGSGHSATSIRWPGPSSVLPVPVGPLCMTWEPSDEAVVKMALRET